MSLLRTASITFTRSATAIVSHTRLVRGCRPDAGAITRDTRCFHNSRGRFAQYERFGFEAPKASGGPGGNRPGGSNPVILALRRRLGDRGIVLWGVGLTGCGVYYVAHLERVPETGRLRFIDVSPEQERAMGLQTQQETLSEYQNALLSPSHPTSKRVREIARRIVEGNALGHMKEDHSLASLPNISLGSIFMGEGEGSEGLFGNEESNPVRTNAAGNKDVEWEVYVIKDDNTKNAFVLPGGKIFVFTGILPVCKNDDGLASVMGHEIAHQVARHSAERVSSMKVLFVLAYLMEALGVDIGIGRVLLTFLMQLPNSRKSESEADHIGIHLMAKACYDPRESTKMWERMSQSEKGSSGGIASVDFMSTHPANAKRIKQLDSWMHEALDMRAATACGDTPSQFEAFKENVPLGNSERVWA